MEIGTIIMNKRKELSLTQQKLADMLHVSYQAVSKWENGSACPEISLLPELAKVLGTSTDTLLGYRSPVLSDYEKRYRTKEYYWGLKPNDLCFEIMKLRPPVEPIRILDIGCGEGKDAVFLAKNGYMVSAFDMSETGLAKAKALAEHCETYVDFFRADLKDFRPTEDYDIIFSSGVLHFLKPELRDGLMESLRTHTRENGLNVMNVFVNKPFITREPTKERSEIDRYPWKSGELFMYYHDWYLHSVKEFVFDCNSGGKPHQHCMDVMIAEKR